MDKIKINCPNCLQEYDVPTDYIGKKAECESCKHVFIISNSPKTKKQKIKGLIGYYKLTDWWFSSFTDAERNLIIKTYHPMGFSSGLLTEQKISGTSQSVISFLSILSAYFSSSDRYLANRILDKAEEVACKDNELCNSDTKNKAQKCKGLIGYYGLNDWWFSTLTKSERKLIAKVYKPKGSRLGLLTEQEINSVNQDAFHFLLDISSYVSRYNADLGERILSKTLELIHVSDPIIDLHLMYHGKIQTNYKDRDIHPKALEKAVDACYSQIAISRKAALAFHKKWGSRLPSHLGFKQLCIIREREKKYNEVVSLCKRAKEEGWGLIEDWNKRIKRCTEKLTKMQNNS